MLSNQETEHALALNAADPAAMAAAAELGNLFGAPISATYTPEMVDLIAEYQASVGLVVDGIVGPETRRRLAKASLRRGRRLLAPLA